MRSQLKSLAFLHVLNDGFQASFLLLLPFIAKDLFFNLTQVGTLGTMMNLFQVVLALPAGIVAIKIGGRKLLLISLLLYGIGYIVATTAQSFVTLMPAFIIAGIGFAFFHPIAFALVSKVSDKKSRGVDMGNFTAIGDLGRIGISSAITFYIAYAGWRTVSLVSGVMIVVIYFFMNFISMKNVNYQKEDKKKSSVGFLELLKNRLFILSSLSGALDSFASSSLFVFLPFLLLARGVNPSVLGSFAAAFFVGNFMGKTLLGRLVDKLGNANVFIASEILMAVFILILANSSSFVVIIVSSIILGIFTKGTVPVIQTMVSAAVEKHGEYEKAFGLNSVIIGLATTLAPLILGSISDKFGIVNAFNITSLFSVIAIVPAILYKIFAADSYHKEVI